MKNGVHFDMPPCSTFKVPLSLMAFDQGILQDENTTYRWDGVDRGIPQVNRDTSAADWIKNSVVWYSQRLTPQLGPETSRITWRSLITATRTFPAG